MKALVGAFGLVAAFALTVAFAVGFVRALYIPPGETAITPDVVAPDPPRSFTNAGVRVAVIAEMTPADVARAQQVIEDPANGALLDLLGRREFDLFGFSDHPCDNGIEVALGEHRMMILAPGAPWLIEPEGEWRRILVETPQGEAEARAPRLGLGADDEARSTQLGRLWHATQTLSKYTESTSR